MPALPETAFFTVTPDWVCEVLSRSTEQIDHAEKLPYYARHGVRHVWLLDPIDKRLEVHSQPFDAIELDLSALWSPPRRG